MLETFTHGYALLIGVGTCKLNPYSLPVSVNDMRALQQLLIRPELCAYPENNVHLLQNESATRQNILNELTWLKKCASNDPNATCLFFYSGHGQYDLAEDIFWLIPHDYHPHKSTTRLTANDLQIALSAITAKRMLVFIDSCHAGGMAHAKDDSTTDSGHDNSTPPESLVASLSQGEGRAVFTSSGEKEKSYYLPDQTLSIYTQHLLTALQGAANTPGDQEIRVGHLMTYLGKAVTKSARDLLRTRQTPRFKFDTQDFPIAMLHGGKGLPSGGWSDVANNAQEVIHSLIRFNFSRQQNITAVRDINAGLINYGDFNISMQGASKEDIFALLQTMSKGDGNTTAKPRSESIPAVQRFALSDIAHRIELSDNAWRMIYRDCRPNDPNTLSEPSLSKMIEDLCNLQRRGNLPPIFEFTERLAWKVESTGDTTLGKDLCRWVNETATLIEPRVTVQDIMALRYDVRKIAISGIDDAHVVLVQIDIRADKYNLNKSLNERLYHVEITEWRGVAHEPNTLHTDEPEGKDIAQLGKGPRLINQLPNLLDQIFDRYPIDPNARLEFITPPELLMADIDRWKYKGRDKGTYGLEYPIVVRLRDRLDIPDNADGQKIFKYWQNKWHKFSQHLCQYDHSAFHWLTDDEVDDLDMIYIDWQDAEGLACLGVATLPNDQAALFKAICDAGIPVAVLARRASPLPDIQSVFSTNPLAELCRVVYQARRNRNYRKDDQHIANHLTLLWDDPTRIPLKYSRKGVYR